MRAPLSATSAAARDLSVFDAATSPTVELDPYRDPMLVPFRKSLPCICGGLVSADIECPAAGIREHQATQRHANWRRAAGL